MSGLIPPFDAHAVFVQPWTDGFHNTIWWVLGGFFVASACGLIGNYLILRRMALVGDAISHAVLPGLVIAFLLTKSRGTWAMFLGAVAAGILTTVLIEIIHKRTRVKQDAAIGVTFSTLFAIGVVLIALFADKVDLDQDCVLYGDIALVPVEPPLAWTLPASLRKVEFGGLITEGTLHLGPPSVFRMGMVALITAGLILLFYKELLVSSFDPGLAAAMGISATVIHYALMTMLSVVVVSSFEAVGAILVIAMLILPGATAMLLAQRLPCIFGLSVLHAALSTILGVHLVVWLDCSVAGGMVVMGALLFLLAWILSPSQGLIALWLRQSGRLNADQNAG